MRRIRMYILCPSHTNELRYFLPLTLLSERNQFYVDKIVHVMYCDVSVAGRLAFGKNESVRINNDLTIMTMIIKFYWLVIFANMWSATSPDLSLLTNTSYYRGTLGIC
jgi:hypothetical protein